MSVNHTNPSFLASLFKREPLRFNLRTSNLLELPNSNTLTYDGLKSITYRGSMAWNSLPDQLKIPNSIDEFKDKLKNKRLSNAHVIFAPKLLFYYYFILFFMLKITFMSYPITPLNGACTVKRIFKDLGIQK